MNSDEIEFEIYLRQQMELELKKATKETEKVLKQKVQESVYDSFSPKYYDRTDSLKESITSENNSTKGKVFFDESKLNHTNDYGETKLVPQYLDRGWKHENWNGGVDNYHERLPANYISETVDTMKNNPEYKDLFDFKIVND